MFASEAAPGLSRAASAASRWSAALAQVAPAGVRAPETQLDPGPFSPGQDGRGLERPDGAPVVAERRQDLAERHLETGAVRVAERDGRLQVRGGLPVRVEPRGAEAGLGVGLRRLRAAAGGQLVPGQRDEAGGLGRGQRIGAQQVGRAPVEDLAAAEAGRLAHGLPEPGVGEVPAGRATGTLDLSHEAAPHELLEGRHRLVLGASAHAPHGGEIEGPAEHGSGREHLHRRLPDGGEPLTEQGPDAASRHVRRTSRRVRPAGSDRPRAHERLRHEQRQALGRLQERPGGRDRQARGTRRRHEQLDRLPVEAGQCELLPRDRVERRDEGGPELVEVLRSPRQDEHQRPGVEPPREPAQRLA